ncbi:MAG: 4-hydroxy-tetrahydrodipicolinate synthase [Candidatus Latescibacterota bacterium]|nr:4-hydroxy-tetrahydrodipicolinate synthase [Candidatus Latescibacterota bacterium]
MFKGCYTASITPMRVDGTVDYDGLERLVEFQISSGIEGVLAVGTTGESPTLLWEEHNEVTERITRACKGRCQSIAGTGSNSTRETIAGTEHAAHIGADAVLLVDPYYNGPSSLEIRREYVAPVAAEFPQMPIIPYVIPGRTGTMMHPQDLAILFAEHPNVCAVKEATGDYENMALTRAVCGDTYTILSGDDDRTVEMMRRDDIRAAGVISVMSNILPGPIQRLAVAMATGDTAAADKLADDMKPLFGIVGVTTTETSPHGTVQCKARNPVPVKTLMNILGMPSGPCRRPLGRLTRQGLDVALGAVKQVFANDPGLLTPIGDFFEVDIEARLNDASLADDLIYTSGY